MLALKVYGLGESREREKQLLTQLLGTPGDGHGHRSSSGCDVGASGAMHSPHFPRILGAGVQRQKHWADRQAMCLSAGEKALSG